MERKIICPAIYKHFKHTDDGTLNNYMYVTIGIAETIDKSKIKEDLSLKEVGLFVETETNHELKILANKENKLLIPMNN